MGAMFWLKAILWALVIVGVIVGVCVLLAIRQIQKDDHHRS